MRTFKVDGPFDPGPITRILKEHFGPDVAIEANPDDRTLSVDRSADPQVVIVLLDGAGIAVIETSD